MDLKAPALQALQVEYGAVSDRTEMYQSFKDKKKIYTGKLTPRYVCDVSLESFYKHFDNMQNINLEDGITDNDTCINEHINISNDVLDMYFTEADVKQGIKKIKWNKSSGIDEVTNEYLKSTEEILLPVWTLLFNHILDMGSIPSNWQVGKIVPKYKNGDTSEASNYRAITITSCLGELFTQLLNTRLSFFVNIHENQTGFRKNHSTIDHIFVIKALFDIYFAKKK